LFEFHILERKEFSMDASQSVEMQPVNSMSEEPLTDFDKLIERDYEALKLKAFNIIGSTKLYLFEADTRRNAACTLISDTYHEAKQKFAQFNPTYGTFVKWYGGFMRLTFWRTLRRCGQHSSNLVQDAPGGCDPPNQHLSFQELDDHLIQREMVEDILSHSHLNLLERIIVELSYWRGWQGLEIAEWFHLSPDYLRAKRYRTLCKARSAAHGLQQDEEANELILLPDDNSHEQYHRLTSERVAGRA
jgi:hypothetical protein